MTTLLGAVVQDLKNFRRCALLEGGEEGGSQLVWPVVHAESDDLVHAPLAEGENGAGGKPVGVRVGDREGVGCGLPPATKGGSHVLWKGVAQ